MKNIRIFLSEKLSFSVVKCSVYFNRRVFEMFFMLCVCVCVKFRSSYATATCDLIDRNKIFLSLFDIS